MPKLFHDFPSKHASLKRDHGHEWVKMTCTPLFSSLPSGVYIRSESAKLECEQHEGRLVLFNACSFVAGGPEPQEGGGLGQAQTFMV